MENKDWKPEVGQVAWWRRDLHHKITEQIVQFVSHDKRKAFLNSGNSVRFERLFPTPEAALASIKVYDLEGKEVVLTRDSSEIDLLVYEGRILSPFELQFYNFCKRDMGVVERFTQSLIGEGIEIAGGSPAAGLPFTKPIPPRTPDDKKANWMLRDELGQTKQDAEAIDQIMRIAYNIEVPPNPEGSARLKAAQARFAAMVEGRETLADPSAREMKDGRTDGGC